VLQELVEEVQHLLQIHLFQVGAVDLLVQEQLIQVEVEEVGMVYNQVQVQVDQE
jgi:hypothetical protein